METLSVYGLKQIWLLGNDKKIVISQSIKAGVVPLLLIRSKFTFLAFNPGFLLR